MNKKILSLILAAVMAFSVAGCGGSDDETTPTVTPTPEVVRTAEPTPTPTPAGEDDKETTEGTENTGETDVEETETPVVPTHKHSFTVVKSYVDATCTEGGTVTFKCDGCNATETKPSTPYGHKYERISTTEPVCGADGKYVNKCSRCGDTYTETVKGDKHVEDNGVVTTVATCTTKGVKTFSCTGCKAVLRTEEIEVIPHTENTGVVTTQPTCRAEGVKTFSCTVCRKVLKTEPVAATGNHTYGAPAITNPTCSAEGEKLYTCSVCNGTKTEPVGKIPHNERDLPAVAPTCSAVGKTEGKDCSVCGETLVAQQVVAINPNAHKPNATTGKCDYCTIDCVGVSSPTELNSAVSSASGPVTIVLADATYSLPDISGKNITFTGSKNAVFELGTNSYSASGANITFDGVTIKWAEAEVYRGIQNAAKIVYNNCEIYGFQMLYNNTDFNNCTFNNKTTWSLWTYGSKNTNFTDCTFNTGGHAVNIYNEQKNRNWIFNVTMTRCTFNTDGSVNEPWGHEDLVENSSPAVASDGKTALNQPGNNKHYLTFTDCKIVGSDKQALWGNKNSMSKDFLDVIVDGVDVY